MVLTLSNLCIKCVVAANLLALGGMQCNAEENIMERS